MSIKQIENEDVYNMEVKCHHNFAVNGGIIVHNCDAIRYFAIMRQLKPKVPNHNKPNREQQFIITPTRDDFFEY